MDYTNYNTIFHRESENKATIIFKSDKLTEDELRNILVFIRRNNITELTVKGTENNYVVPKEAFLENELLEKVIIDNTIIHIFESAFASCEQLQEVILPKKLLVIENNAFSECSSLNNVVIPNKVSRLGSSVFSYCDALTNIVLGKHIKYIGDDAFAYSGIKQSNGQDNILVIPNSVTYIGKRAFSECINLSQIQLSISMKIIAEECFKNCMGLEYVRVDMDCLLKSIAPNAFENCENLKLFGPNYNIARSVFRELRDMPEETFPGVIIIPNVMKLIGAGAFYGCKLIEYIILGKSLNFIQNKDNDVFYRNMDIVASPAFNITASTYVRKIAIPENSSVKLEKFFPASPYFDARPDNFEYYDTNTRSAMGSKKRKSKKSKKYKKSTTHKKNKSKSLKRHRSKKL